MGQDWRKKEEIEMIFIALNEEDGSLARVMAEEMGKSRGIQDI